MELGILKLFLKNRLNNLNIKIYIDIICEGDLMKEKVYQFLLTIPSNKVTTYGQIAEYLGNKNLARVVGNILHNNPDKEKYPCYKVVTSKGKLSKKFAFGGIECQRKSDGIKVINYKVDLCEYMMKKVD